MSRVARIVGVGDYTPSNRITNEQIARAIPGWGAELIREKTGILERRFLCALDEVAGRSLRPWDGVRSNTDMAEVALREALEMGCVLPSSVDALFLVTSTPDRPDFSHDAMQLHRRLGLRADALAFVINDGCGGTPYVLDLVNKLLTSGGVRTAAVVASNFASAYVDRRVYTDPVAVGGHRLSGFLSMYVFGDGAGAVVLRGDEGPGGVLDSLVLSSHEPLVVRRGGGAECPVLLDDARPGDFAFVVNGREVAASYPHFMRACVEGVTRGAADEVRRFYLHQPNKRVLERFMADAGLSPSQVACTVERYGNTSAAGMLVALSEDVRQGVVRLGDGELVCIAAVGANVHAGAQLIRL
ncbi:MAG: 3-oxoacyl-[acyl-carrier-protein] synthase III C-terminal domain-containing protein [Myxococcota bacterium]